MSQLTYQNQRHWSVGGIFAAVLSLISLITIIGSIWWFAARISYATDKIPTFETQQQTNTRDISNLQLQQKFSDSRYTEILTQLRQINRKIEETRNEQRH